MDDVQYRQQEDHADVETIDELKDAALLVAEQHNKGSPPTSKEFAFHSGVSEKADKFIRPLLSCEPTLIRNGKEKDIVQSAGEVNSELSDNIEHDDESGETDVYARAGRSIDQPTQECE